MPEPSRPEFKPSLLAKGLILISVPLLFELGFGVTLLQLQDQYEKQLAEQVRINSIIYHANELLLTTTEAVTTKMAATIFKRANKRLDMKFQEMLPKIDTEYQVLHELVSKDSEQLEMINRLKSNTDGMLSATQNFESDDDLSIAPFASLRGGIQNFRQLKYSMDRLGENIRAFRAPWEERSKDAARSISTAKEKIQLVTVASLVTSLLIAGMLFAYFFRQIYNNINMLIQNTHRLAGGQALLPVLKSKDEFGHLDQQFHHMADSLRESAQMKQEFFDMVSHDMRTPLSSIVVSVESLLVGMVEGVPPEVVGTLEKTERNAQHLVNLINNLLDMEKLEKEGIVLACETFDLMEACSLTAEIVHPLADQSGVKIALPSKPPTIYADKDRVTRVLINLVSNAVKFSPNGGSVKIDVTDQADEVEIAVIDQGRGIPPNMQETVFERFKQVSAEDATKKGGSGLGLAICKGFVVAHGGTIGVTSEPGKGSKFWFRLPKRAPLALTAESGQQQPVS